MFKILNSYSQQALNSAWRLEASYRYPLEVVDVAEYWFYAAYCCVVVAAAKMLISVAVRWCDDYPTLLKSAMIVQIV